MSEPGRRLLAGMVGGGPGAMIGSAHRYAMNLDGQYDLPLVILAASSPPERIRSLGSGPSVGSPAAQWVCDRSRRSSPPAAGSGCRSDVRCAATVAPGSRRARADETCLRLPCCPSGLPVIPAWHNQRSAPQSETDQPTTTARRKIEVKLVGVGSNAVAQRGKE